MEWPDGKQRCFWANPKNQRYIQYHDEEWGVPVYDDGKLFEMLLLESFQAGLSWECVLNKREAFREAFDHFDYKKLKIQAAVTNAKIFQEIQKEYQSFSNYLWHWTDGKIIYETGLAHSPLSDSVSKDLKKRGMKFVGTTIIYAYMQAVGVIDSHEKGCFKEPSNSQGT